LPPLGVCIRPPAEWIERCSPCPMIEIWMVMPERGGPLLSQLMEKTASIPQVNDMWSRIMFSPLDMPEASFPELSVAPSLTLKKQAIVLLEPEKLTRILKTTMPSPGAVCPAMVVLAATFTSEFNLM